VGEQTTPRTAESYRIHKGGLDVDGQPFPWHVLADPGPLVSPLGLDVDDMHILWLPVLVDAYLPPVSTPAETNRSAP
jgi:hypothetical protein